MARYSVRIHIDTGAFLGSFQRPLQQEPLLKSQLSLAHSRFFAGLSTVSRESPLSDLTHNLTYT
jgi:hypothetical protein